MAARTFDVSAIRNVVASLLDEERESVDEATEARIAPWLDPWKRGKVRAGWRADWKPNGVWAHSADGLRVFLTGRVWSDGRCWLHVSYSRAKRVPSYEDTTRVRKLFLGDDHWTYAIYPPKAQYVNVHSFTLHLWMCLDGPVTPDFSTMVGETRVV